MTKPFSDHIEKTNRQDRVVYAKLVKVKETSIVVASKRTGHKLCILREVKTRDRRILGGSDAANNWS